MSPLVRRARGVLLRLARRRVVAGLAGLLLLIPAVVVQVQGTPYWWAEGLSLILGATGVALLWTGVAGPRPDWVE